MNSYKLYYLDDWSHILRRVDVDHVSDLAACAAAVALDHAFAIEVWDGARRVVLVHPNHRQPEWFAAAAPFRAAIVPSFEHVRLDARDHAVPAAGMPAAVLPH